MKTDRWARLRAQCANKAGTVEVDAEELQALLASNDQVAAGLRSLTSIASDYLAHQDRAAFAVVMGAPGVSDAAMRQMEAARERLEAVLGAKRAPNAGNGATARPATFAEALERVADALDGVLDASRDAVGALAAPADEVTPDEKAAEIFIPDFIIEFTRKEVEIEDPDGEVGDTMPGDPQGVLDGALADALDNLTDANASPLAIRAVAMLRDTAEFGIVTEYPEEDEEGDDSGNVSAPGGEA
jgi:hypothetical protein